jgi:hypothetical protein
MDDTDLLVVPAAAAGRRARGSGRAMSEEVSRCHSWGLTNTIRMKSVTFGKLITPESRAMNGIHQLQPLLLPGIRAGESGGRGGGVVIARPPDFVRSVNPIPTRVVVYYAHQLTTFPHRICISSYGPYPSFKKMPTVKQDEGCHKLPRWAKKIF